jgi:hypothetical protein
MFGFVLWVNLVEGGFTEFPILDVFAIRAVGYEDRVLDSFVRIKGAVHIDADETIFVGYKGDIDVLFVNVGIGGLVNEGELLYLVRHFVVGLMV